MNNSFQIIASLGLNQGVECNQGDKCNIQNNIDTCTDYWMHDQLLCTNGDDFVCNVQAEDIHTHNCKEQDPDSEIENSGKAFLKSESRTSVTFKLQFLTLAIYQWQLLGLGKYATMKNM